MQENGVPIQVYLQPILILVTSISRQLFYRHFSQMLDWHAENGDKNSSITKNLMSHTIDLFINLPSKNKYRRPSSFMSRGYLLRRVAVDFSVPLITNIKCAKLFTESIAYMRSGRELGYYGIFQYCGGEKI